MSNNTAEMSPEQREYAIATILWELARKATQAARVTGDPRLAAIAAVAVEQLKNTTAFDAILTGDIGGESQQPSQPATMAQNAYAQAQAMMSQQNAQWSQILETQRQSNARLNQEIDALTFSALQSMQNLMQNRNHSNVQSDDGSSGRTPDQSA